MYDYLIVFRQIPIESSIQASWNAFIDINKGYCYTLQITNEKGLNQIAMKGDSENPGIILQVGSPYNGSSMLDSIMFLAMHDNFEQLDVSTLYTHLENSLCQKSYSHLQNHKIYQHNG